MRFHRHALAIVLGLSLVAGAAQGAEGDKEKEAPIPPAAKSALDRLEKSEEKLTQEYKHGVMIERQKTIAELQKILKDTTKTGDLDLANAVKGRIDALIAKSDADEETDLIGGKKPLDTRPLLGIWTFQKSNGQAGTLEFVDGGRVLAQLTSPLPIAVTGKWEVKDGRVQLTWGDPSRLENLALTSPTKLDGDSFDAGKNGFHATKNKK